ncbi:MAG: Lrp/AsnC family transcriptional regulator [Deltaproteobacteria bacterium]|uniref:siroheme decarboxylase n=1 Tax=Candidatus Zymogenus saltonus TaxID=2844893 RepID=A0A9D8KGX5_9DELT|nr:Lrp/AsnC family transcriptional regulator [Candidatus Zymogenus saltonus]
MDNCFDETDGDILRLIQEGFPLTGRPFKEVADKLKTHPRLDESEVMRRVAALKEKGVIRRIGAVIDGRAFGIVTTLLGAKVPAESVDLFADVVNSYSRVTHNYLRDEDRNIWFTIWGKSGEEIEKTIDEIKVKTGVTDILSFPSRKTYKIRAVFDIPNRL